MGPEVETAAAESGGVEALALTDAPEIDRKIDADDSSEWILEEVGILFGSGRT